MNSSPSQPQFPSSEFRWGLLSLDLKAGWVGLTEREFVMFYELMAKTKPHRWIMWHISWTEWKLVSKVTAFWTYTLPEPEDDLPPPRLPLLTGNQG